MGKLIFITGTDTGVGKTLLTASWLCWLREGGINALAMKPFCSGSRADVELMQAFQHRAISLDEANPFFFPEAVAPLVSARRHRRRITLGQVLERIEQVQSRCDLLLIEGAGGVTVPLGEGYSVASLIARLRAAVVVVGCNRLGTINHTLLTVNALQAAGKKRISVVLMDVKKADFSARTNREILRELLAPMEVWQVPYLGRDALRVEAVKEGCKKIKKTLARLTESGNLSPVLWDSKRLATGNRLTVTARAK